MSKRTFKNGHAITTFPSNNGFCTALIGKYGETLKVIYSANTVESNRNHDRITALVQEHKNHEQEKSTQHILQL